ncbi:MAG: hypothetical protein R3240_13360, partial [Gammaproteobacteria bacterium]|nr:hypothetical protein [Gammaproteobacteria bacterium]
MASGVFRSLKSRYAFFSLFLAVLVLACAVIGYIFVSKSQSNTMANEQYRGELQKTTRDLRNAIWISREMLEEFLLEPSAKQLKPLIFQELKASKEKLIRVKAGAGNNNIKIYSQLDELQVIIDQLSQNIERVIETRVNGFKQYPAIAIASEQMQPNQEVFFSAVELASQEILEDGSGGVNLPVYQDFQSARNLWSHLILNFRMYLSNRLGSFFEETIPVQEKNSLLLIEEIYQILDRLQMRESNGELGLQASESVLQMRQSLDKWVQGHAMVLEIHRSGNWRTDKSILLSDVNPLYLKIWGLMQEVEDQIKRAMSHDISSLGRISNLQMQMIWGASFVALLFIVVGYFYLQRYILKPISLL